MPAYSVSVLGVSAPQHVREQVQRLLAPRPEPWMVRLVREGQSACYLRLECPGFLAERLINVGGCNEEELFEALQTWLSAYDQ